MKIVLFILFLFKDLVLFKQTRSSIEIDVIKVKKHVF